MNPESVTALYREALTVLAIVGGPLFLALLGVGLVVGILQSATQVQEPAVGAVPRIATILVVSAVGGPWVVERLAHFLSSAIERLAERGF